MAAINIAHNPAANIAGLYALAMSTPPFAPALSAAPNDWTVAISLTGGGIFSSSGIAIDGAGNAWVANPKYVSGPADTVVELSSLGAPLSGPNGYTGGGLVHPVAVAIDQSGNAWVADSTVLVGIKLIEISGTGQFLSGTSGFQATYNNSNGVYYIPGGVGGSSGVGIDGAGNVWVPAPSSVSSIAEFSDAGVLTGLLYGFGNDGLDEPGGVATDPLGNAWISEPIFNQVTVLQDNTNFFVNGRAYGPGGGLNQPSGVAVDSANNVWVANTGGDSLTKMSNTGAFLSGASGFTGGGLSGPDCIAIDGAGNVWAGGSNSTNVVEFSNAGVVLSGANGYLHTGYVYQNEIAIDGSGDVWTTHNWISVDEIIGAAVPVVTPLSVGVQSNTLGTRP
jgi:hypothetical protein